MSIALIEERKSAVSKSARPKRPLRAIKSKNRINKIISPRKLAANRRNSQKSTGPKTPTGKKIASQNSLKHGLCSQSPRLPNECSATYNIFVEELKEFLHPQNPLQFHLFDQACSILWKLQRVNDTEAHLYALRQKHDDPPCLTLAKAFNQNPTANPFLTYSRYERHLRNTWLRLVRELKTLQKQDATQAAQDRHSEPAWSPEKMQAQIERFKTQKESNQGPIASTDWYKQMTDTWRQRDQDRRLQRHLEENLAIEQAAAAARAAESCIPLTPSPSTLDVERWTLNVESEAALPIEASSRAADSSTPSPSTPAPSTLDVERCKSNVRNEATLPDQPPSPPSEPEISPQTPPNNSDETKPISPSPTAICKLQIPNPPTTLPSNSLDIPPAPGGPTMLRAVIALCIMLLVDSQICAAPVTYTIDPTQSLLRADGLLSSNVPSPQTFNSNLTTYNGTISADRGANSIQFTPGSFIDADRQPSKQQPDIGGEDGSAVADYGLVAPNMFSETYAAFRDLIFDLSSDPLAVASNGNFDSGFDIIYSSGGVDYNRGFQFGSRDFTGSDLFNLTSGTPTVVVANGIETLTLPLRFSKFFSTETTNDSTFRLSGTIVATRSLSNTPPQWKTDGSGSWNDPSNWDGGIPNSATASANFLGAITSPQTVTLDGDKTVGAIYFDNPNSYTIAPGTGGTLTVVGGVDVNGNNINVSTGSHTIAAPLLVAASTGILVKPGASLTISGPFSLAPGVSIGAGGVITISGPQNHGANTVYDTEGVGLTTFATNAGTPATAASPATANLFIDVGADASVTFTADQDLHSLGLATGDGPEHIDLASPAGAAAFRAIRIYGDDLAVAKSILWQSIASANVADSADPTIGIFDSGRPLHPGSGIGIAQTTDAHGDPVLFIRLTRIGDVNLDGQVTIADFIGLASNFNKSGPDITWQEGDMNYDGQVTISDFLSLAANFNTNYAGQTTPISPADAALLNDFASAHGITLVPEPSILFFLFVCAFLLAFRQSHLLPHR